MRVFTAMATDYVSSLRFAVSRNFSVALSGVSASRGERNSRPDETRGCLRRGETPRERVKAARLDILRYSKAYEPWILHLALCFSIGGDELCRMR